VGRSAVKGRVRAELRQCHKRSATEIEFRESAGPASFFVTVEFVAIDPLNAGCGVIAPAVHGVVFRHQLAVLADARTVICGSCL